MSRKRKLAILVLKQGGICYLCHGPLRRPTVDHIYPRARGGSSALKNLKAACYVCNWEKGCMTVGQYRQFRAQREAA